MLVLGITLNYAKATYNRVNIKLGYQKKLHNAASRSCLKIDSTLGTCMVWMLNGWRWRGMQCNLRTPPPIAAKTFKAIVNQARPKASSFPRDEGFLSMYIWNTLILVHKKEAPFFLAYPLMSIQMETIFFFSLIAIYYIL